MISFAHVRKTGNVGDKMCTPALYFEFENAALYDIRAEIPPSDAVIFGGGALEYALRGADAVQKKISARHKIAWGIGASRHGTEEHPGPVEGFDLLGIREFNRPGGDYVPCVSCMSKLFDQKYEITEEAVIFVNKDRKIAQPTIDGFPKMHNVGKMEEVIKFIASGETLITNSYHGVYWATLLGRKVVCLPYSSKFHGFKFPPAMATVDSWQQARSKAISYDEALADCRSRNLVFHQKVMDLLSLHRG